MPPNHRRNDESISGDETLENLESSINFLRALRSLSDGLLESENRPDLLRNISQEVGPIVWNYERPDTLETLPETQKFLEHFNLLNPHIQSILSQCIDDMSYDLQNYEYITRNIEEKSEEELGNKLFIERTGTKPTVRLRLVKNYPPAVLLIEDKDKVNLKTHLHKIYNATQGDAQSNLRGVLIDRGFFGDTLPLVVAAENDKDAIDHEIRHYVYHAYQLAKEKKQDRRGRDLKEQLRSTY